MREAEADDREEEGHANDSLPSPLASMSNPYSESATQDVLYPDDLEGRKFRVLSDQPLDASEVDDENAKYGQFSKAKTSDDTEVWLSSPKALRQFIGEHYDELVREGLPMEVTMVEKGTADHDPYVIEARVIESGDPL